MDAGEVIAGALAAEQPFAPRRVQRAVVLQRVQGNITTLHKIEVVLDDGSNGVYWLKSYSGKPDDAQLEWRFLQQRTQYGRCGLVEGVAFLQSINAVMTRHADGVRLSEAMTAENVRDAGAWLGALHKTALDSTHDADALIADVAQRAGKLGLRLVVDGELPAEDLTRVRTHGDFAPFNILVSDERMTVIDPSFEPSVARLDNYCTRHEDYSRFMTCIAETGHDSIAPHFRDGYKESSGIDPESSDVYRLLRLKYALQALLDRWAGHTAQAQRLGTERFISQWL